MHQWIFTWVMQCCKQSSHESCSVVNKLLWSNYVDDSKCRHRLYKSTGMQNRTKQNLFVCIGKYQVEVTNNKRLIMCWRYCTVESNYRQTHTVEWPLCDSRASCMSGFYFKLACILPSMTELWTYHITVGQNLMVLDHSDHQLTCHYKIHPTKTQQSKTVMLLGQRHG